MAEHTFALLLALRRQVHSYHADILAGAWQRSAHFALLGHPLNDLHGSTLGIFGYGHIGQAVARIAEAFGMRVLVAEHKDASSVRTGRVPFNEMLEQADAVTLHCPLTPQTRNLIGAPELYRMKPGAILLNLARGGVVDEAALARALREERIAGAGVDVLTSEPPRAGNPLLEMAGPTCIVTPHVAWASQQSLVCLADEIVRNIEAFYAGESRNRIV